MAAPLRFFVSLIYFRLHYSVDEDRFGLPSELVPLLEATQ
jgi:hypothetical protein